MLPPPIDDCSNSSSASSGKPIVKNGSTVRFSISCFGVTNKSNMHEFVASTLLCALFLHIKYARRIKDCVK